MNGPDNNDTGDDDDEDDNGNGDEEETNDEAIGREDGDPTGMDCERKATSSSISSSSSSRMGISSSGTSCKGVLPNIMRLRQICDFTVAISNGNEEVVESSVVGNNNTYNNSSGSSNCSASASSSSSSNANHTIETGNVLSPCVPYALVMYVLKYSVLFLAT